MQQKFLEFIVDDQFIRAPHYTVVADSRDYLVARFTFSEQWQGLTKTAVFQGADGKAYFVVLDKDTCPIPWEVIQPTRFLVSVFGGDRLTADRAMVEVAASGFTANGVTPPAPTPDVYNQVMEAVSLERQLAENAATTATEKAEQCVYLTSSAESLLQEAASVDALVAAARQAEQKTAAYAAQVEESVKQMEILSQTALQHSEMANAHAASAYHYSERSRTAAEEAKTAAQTAVNALAQVNREWELLDDVAFTETTTEYFLTLSQYTFKEIYVEGIVISADKTTSSQQFVIGTGPGRAIWSANAGFGNTTYVDMLVRGHMYLSPSGTVLCNGTASFFGYTVDGQGNHFTTTGRFGENSFIGSTKIEAVFLKVAGGFAAGTTFKIWGR